MEKAFLTVVVAGESCREVVDHLHQLDRNCVVLVAGDIHVTGKELSTLQNEVWLHGIESTSEVALIKDGASLSEGRALTDDELSALTEYGVCVEMKVMYTREVSQSTPPPEAIYTAMVEASNFGFKVADTADFETNYQCGNDDAIARRWLRVRVPAWMNFAATL